MTSFNSSLHLLFDGVIRKAVGIKQSVAGGPRTINTKGASKPGGQVHLAAAPIKGSDGFPLLKTGDTKHSMWRTVEWQLLLPIIKDLPRPILDLGCGDGAFGALFTDNIEYGIDGYADAVGQCNPEVYEKFFPGDLRETLAIPKGTLGAAFSNSTLEHVSPLEPAIASVSEALRPGGKLVITVPTNGLTDAITSAFSSGLADRINTKLGHHNLWPWSQWEELLRAHGFSEVEMRGYLTKSAMRFYASRGLAPWPQISRRSSEWLWRHDLPQIKRHIQDSLNISAEEDSTCLLIIATRGGQ